MRQILIGTLLAVFAVASTASAQNTFVAIDAPAQNSVARQPFLLGGWAVDWLSTVGPGVSVIHVWAYPNPGSGEPGVMIGAMIIGPARQDVADAFGAQFRDSAFGMMVKGLPPKPYQFHLFPWSTVSNGFTAPTILNLTVLADPRMNVDAPLAGAPVVQPFTLGGWAVDLAALTDTGVSTVHVWAFPASGAPPMFVGVHSAPHFGYRPDVGNYFGNAQFNQSGFNVQVSGLPAGAYSLVSSAWSTVGNGFTQAFSVPVNIDTPVAAPVFSPPPGTNPSAQSVSMTSATSGATIHYTTNGDEPTASSPAFSAPIALTPFVETTIKAKAFLTGFVSSTTTSGVYLVGAVDSTPPQITARAVPAATPSGWSNSGVVITFVCIDPESGIATCPGPVYRNTESTWETITGTAVNYAGNSSSTSITLRIDKTPGSVVISSPADGTTTTSPSVALTATAVDTLSGLVSASCNGVPASLAGSAVNCTVSLQPGLNNVVLQVMDAAGNSASHGIRITKTGTPTSISLEPQIRTLAIGQSTPLRVVDQFGQTVSGATWSTSDASVAQISSPSPDVAIAVAPGNAVITASWQGLTANLSLSVSPGTSIPDGTMRWQIATTPGRYTGSPIYSNRVGPGVPDLFSVEWDASVSGHANIRALQSDGQELWRESLVGEPAFGDAFGGIVGITPVQDRTRGALLRVGSGVNVMPWRFESRGLLGQPAQASDGTIYVMEWIAREPGVGYFLDRVDAQLVVIDGNSGRVRARVTLPISSIEYSRACPNESGRHESAVNPTGPTISHDGSAYLAVPVSVQVSTRTANCVQPDTETVDRELRMLRISADGSETWLPSIWQYSYAGPVQSWHPSGVTGPLLVDESGAVLAEWGTTNAVTGLPTWSGVVRFSGLTKSAYAIPEGSALSLLADGNLGFLSRSDGAFSAFDSATGSVLWTTPAIGGSLVAALDGGGIAVHNPTTGLLRMYTAYGELAAPALLSLREPVSELVMGRFHGMTSEGGPLREVAGPLLQKSRFSFQRGGGNPQRQSAPRVRYFQSKHQAAVSVLQEEGPWSVVTDREAGGSICQRASGVFSGRFFASTPARNLAGSGSVTPSSCPAALPSTVLGEYHTHSQGFFFSANDVSRMHSSFGLGKTFWLSNPCGDIWEYASPQTLPIPANHVSATSVRRPERIETMIKCVQ